MPDEGAHTMTRTALEKRIAADYAKRQERISRGQVQKMAKRLCRHATPEAAFERYCTLTYADPTGDSAARNADNKKAALESPAKKYSKAA